MCASLLRIFSSHKKLSQKENSMRLCIGVYIRSTSTNPKPPNPKRGLCGHHGHLLLCCIVTGASGSNPPSLLGPKGPRTPDDPNNRVLGPKYYNIHCIWALKPYYFLLLAIGNSITFAIVVSVIILAVKLSPFPFQLLLAFLVLLLPRTLRPFRHETLNHEPQTLNHWTFQPGNSEQNPLTFGSSNPVPSASCPQSSSSKFIPPFAGLLMVSGFRLQDTRFEDQDSGLRVRP